MATAYIHWASARRCRRKDSKADERVTRLKNGTTITHTGVANHPENVTCIECRKEIKARRARS